MTEIVDIDNPKELDKSIHYKLLNSLEGLEPEIKTVYRYQHKSFSFPYYDYFIPQRGFAVVQIARK